MITATVKTIYSHLSKIMIILIQENVKLRIQTQEQRILEKLKMKHVLK